TNTFCRTAAPVSSSRTGLSPADASIVEVKRVLLPGTLTSSAADALPAVRAATTTTITLAENIGPSLRSATRARGAVCPGGGIADRADCFKPGCAGDEGLRVAGRLPARAAAHRVPSGGRPVPGGPPAVPRGEPSQTSKSPAPPAAR